MVIRWMGAFRRQGSLADSLRWELEQRDASALAAERLRNGRSAIRRAKVGLLVKNRAILRRFSSDVSSRYRGKVLVKGRREGVAHSEHTECWVKPDFAAIVVKGRISPKATADVWAVAEAAGIPVLRLTRDGRLVNMRA